MRDLFCWYLQEQPHTITSPFEELFIVGKTYFPEEIFIVRSICFSLRGSPS